MKATLLSLWFGLCLTCFGHAAFAADTVTKIDVPLRPGVSSEIAVTVRKNPYAHPCFGRTIAAVHGFAHTAATWDPLVDEMFSHASPTLVCRAALIDLPGHGQSALPKGLPFGEVSLNDYVTAVIGVLDGLDKRGIHPNAVVGHSMGGLIVEATQARLLGQQTSLAQRYGIFLAVLLSPTPAAEHPWPFAETGQAAQVISTFVTGDPIKGTVVRFDPVSWEFLFFTNLAEELAPGTPSPGSVVANGYLSDEPLIAAAELVGLPPWSRLSAGNTSFAPNHGTLLLLVNPSQDRFNLRQETKATYVQLTGDSSLTGFLEIDDPFAVHDLHVAEPALYLQKVGQAIFSKL